MRNPFEGLFKPKKELPKIQGMDEHVNNLFQTTGDEIKRVAAADAEERQRARDAAEQVQAAREEEPLDPFETVDGKSQTGEWSKTAEYTEARQAREAEQASAAEGARENLENIG